MVTSIPKVFIDEADSLLIAIRGSILVRLPDGVRPEHLSTPLSSARSLTSLASESGDERLAVAAETLEAWLMLLAAETEALSHARTSSLLDQISELEMALIAYRARTSPETLEVADFVDESFRGLSLDADSQSPDPAPTEEIDAFEIDAEMLDVFRREAEALLDTIQTNLKLLANERGDREALWNIQKAAHTFKGAAGVVGLHKLSGIAHRIEDFLDYLSSQEKSSNVQVVDVLVNATECLQSLSNGDDSQRVGTRIEKLEGEFADTLRAISTNALSNISHGPPLPPDAIAESDVPVPQAPAKPERSPVVRISMERLDGLGHIIRDLVSSRTIFEARIDELAAQIQESCNNTLRLQAATSKIKKGDSSSYRSEPANGAGPPAVFDQTTYELTETARDASLINSSLKNIKTGFEDVFVQQRALIERMQGRLIRLRNVEFGTIFTRLQRAVRMTCEEEGKNAEIEIENGALEVDTQIVDQLIEPLMHLLKNAVVHGIEPPEIRRMLGKPEVGRIVVRVGTDGPNILLSVTDDGSGIAYQTLVEKAVVSGRISREEAERMTQSQIRELVFLPGLTTAEKLNLNAGRGVGMSIVRESVAAAQGTVSFETLPQKGTTFKIRIPLPFADFCFSESTKDQRMDEPTVHELTLLVVDDSPSVRLMTSRVLQDAGWHVLTAGNGIDALEKLAEMDPLPNIILSDIEMPQMGGYEFLAALSEDPALKTIPVVVVSSRAGSENRDQALDAGAIEYFTKPYNERDVIEFLDRFARSEILVSAS